MSIEAVVDLLACPHCRGPLRMDQTSVCCARGHRFDIARQGYLNLYGGRPPANADTPAMIAARERVLGSGVYDPVAAAVRAAAAAAGGADPGPGLAVLDCGTGTGHYLRTVLDGTMLDGTMLGGTMLGGTVLGGAVLGGAGARGIALDISVAAARRAAVQGVAAARIGAVVADAWRRLPLADAAVDVVLSVFAPRNGPEFARVLRSGGSLIVAYPGPRHLAELRPYGPLLAVDDDKPERLRRDLAGGFVPEEDVDVLRQDRWSAALARDVLAMGPNAHHLDPARLELPDELDVTVAVTVSRWQRR